MNMLIDCPSLPSECRKVRATVEYITPKFAEKALAANTENQRHVNQSNLALAERALKAGEWVLNGESIIISATGRVLDGQHRFIACVNTGVPFFTVLVTGVPDEYFSTIDSGRSRSLADVLVISGTERHAHLPAAINLLVQWQRGTIHRTEPLSHQEAMAEIEKHPRLIDSVRWCHNHIGKYVAASRIGWIHYLVNQHKCRFATEFFERLSDGIGLAGDDPVYHLRARLYSDRVGNAKLGRTEILALIIKAWNAKASGKRMKLLRMSDGEPFPSLVLE